MSVAMIDKEKNRFLYCPIGIPQRRFGAYVTGAGHELTRPGEPYPHAYHSSDYFFTWAKGRRLADWEYQILYIRSGEGVIEFNRGKPIAIKAGTLIILHPGEWHRYRPDPGIGWEEAYIGIGGTLMERITDAPFFTANPILISLPPGGWFDRELLSLVEEIPMSYAEHPYTLALKTMTLIASVVERAHTFGQTDAHNAAIRKATIHVGHHLGEIVDFKSLAASYGMGYSLFRKRFHDYTGLAPLEYQNALRIRRAMHLLTSSDTPVSQIADELGFNTAAYFSRFFRHSTGQSPISYRRSNKSGSRDPKAPS